MGTEVSRYGVHWAPGRIAFLEQQRGGTNAVGVRQPSPFRVRTHRRWACNHLIATNATNPAREHLMVFRTLIECNDLVRFMLPVPKADTQAGVVHDVDLFYTTLLLKMTSPVKLPIFWASLANPKAIRDELEMTDVQPLVLAGVKVKHEVMARELMQVSTTHPRRLLVVTEGDVPLAPNLTISDLLSRDRTDLLALPWETLGAIVLRAHMRGEWNGTWFTREPVPGNEVKMP